MIKTVRFGNLLHSTEKHIAFAISKEAISDTKIVKDISKIWPEITKDQNYNLGSVIKKEIDNKTYYALICYSYRSGWNNQKEMIEKCLDQIDTNETIAIEEIGFEKKIQSMGAKPIEIKQQMQKSPKQLILYKDIKRMN